MICSVTVLLPVLERYIDGITQHATLLRLASGDQHDVSEIHPRRSLRPQVVPFHCSVVFHRMDDYSLLPQPSIEGGFQLLANPNEAATNTGVWVSKWLAVFISLG